ncbi:hypothetical protein D1V13_001218 [Escherichia coli]|nr:hypothetical protein [Escherichia coli]
MKILVYGINYSPELTGIGKYTGEMVEWLAYSAAIFLIPICISFDTDEKRR